MLSHQSDVIDILERKGNTIIHKQIEHRNGLVFIRMKKRKVSQTV